MLVRWQIDTPAPPAMVEGLQLVESPVVGVMELVSVTVVVKRFWPVMLVVKVAVLPGGVKMRLTELIVNEVVPLT